MIRQWLVDSVIRHANDYYEKGGKYFAGGNCHIVLDDGNLEDDNIKFCFDLCKKEDDFDGISIMNFLSNMTMGERISVYNGMNKQ